MINSLIGAFRSVIRLVRRRKPFVMSSLAWVLALWGVLAGMPMPAHGSAPLVLARAETEGGRQVLKDTGFETDVTWQPYETGFERSTERAHGGRFSIRCTNAAGDLRGASQEIVLDQKVPMPIFAAAYSACTGVSGSPDPDYSLYLDILFQDGTPLWGQSHAFPTGTHGWQKAEVMVLPEKPIRLVRLYVLFRRHAGTAYFDDVSLRELAPGTASVFDTVPVRFLPSSPPVSGKSVNVRGGRLHLRLDAESGAPRALAWNDRNIPGTVGAGGFLVRDAAKDSGFYGLRAPLRPDGKGKYRQDGAISALGLGFSARYEPMGDAVAISGSVEDRSGKDRAVTVYYALPVPPKDLTWWDTPRESRPVVPPGVYADTANIGAGNTGQMSRFPLACLSGPAADLCLAFPMDQARVARLVYDAGTGLYYAAFDFGLVPHQAPATFRLVLYANPPGGGYRGALAQYYRLFPEAFRKRVTKEGIWMPFSRISTVERPEDFGFAFKEGDNETAWDDAHGIATFRYTEPMTWWMPIPAGVERNYDVCLDYLHRYAAGTFGSPDQRQMARATLISADEGEDGKLAVSVVDAPWAHGGLFIQDCNPRLPDTPDAPNRAHVAWSGAIAAKLYGDASKGVLDGEYLDSLEGWAETKDFSREHFRYATEPLTFDSTTKRPCILQASSTLEFTRWMAGDVHKRGKLMFANGTPWRFPWYAPYLDVMGSETKWISDGEYRPESDATMLYRRMVTYHKPYLLLMNVDYDAFDHAMVDRYLQRCLFYGIFPSMFSHNAANNPYWENPAWYNRDRDLFRKVIPVVRDLATLGWEPVTGAKTDTADVWVERYGGTAGRDAAFTVLNAGSAARDVMLTVDRKMTGWWLAGLARDRLTGARLPIERNAGAATLRLHLVPDQAMVLFPLPRWQTLAGSVDALRPAHRRRRSASRWSGPDHGITRVSRPRRPEHSDHR